MLSFIINSLCFLSVKHLQVHLRKKTWTTTHYRHHHRLTDQPTPDKKEWHRMPCAWIRIPERMKEKQEQNIGLSDSLHWRITMGDNLHEKITIISFFSTLLSQICLVMATTQPGSPWRELWWCWQKWRNGNTPACLRASPITRMHYARRRWLHLIQGREIYVG